MADVNVTFGAKDEGLAAEFGKVGKQASALGGLIGKVFLPLAVLAGGFFAAKGAAEAFASVVAKGGKLSDLAAAFQGLPIDKLVILQRAFANAGMSADDAAPMFGKLAKNILELSADAGEVAWFEQFGVSLEKLKNQTPDEQFRALAEVFSQLPDEAAKNDLAIRMFGKSFVDVKPLLANFTQEYQEAKEQLGSAPELYAKNAKHLDTIGDSFAGIGEKGEEFLLGLTDGILPSLADLAEKIARLDFAGLGKGISDAVAEFWSGVTSAENFGRAVDGLSVAFDRVAGGDVVGGLALAFASAQLALFQVINDSYAFFSATVTTAAEFLRSVFSPEGATVHFLRSVIQGIGALMESVFAGAVGSVLQSLSASGGILGKVFSAQFREFGEAATYQSETAAKRAEMLIGGLGVAGELAGEQIGESLVDSAEAFALALENGANKELIQTDKLAGSIAAQLAEAAEKAKDLGEVAPEQSDGGDKDGKGKGKDKDGKGKGKDKDKGGGGGGGGGGISGGAGAPQWQPSAAVSQAQRRGEWLANQGSLPREIQRAEKSGNFGLADTLQKQYQSVVDQSMRGAAQSDLQREWGIEGGNIAGREDLARKTLETEGRLIPSTEEIAQRLGELNEDIATRVGQGGEPDGTPAEAAGGGEGKGGKQGEGGKDAAKGGLEGVMAKIQAVVEKIEAKLPVAVLG